MKMHVDIDISAEEVRTLLGLPDVAGLQQHMLDEIQARLEQGTEGYDPLELMQPYLKSSQAGMEMMQRLFAAGFKQPPGRGDAEG